MTDLASGSRAKLILEVGQVFRVSTVGTATLTPAYGVPDGDIVITAGFKDIGPFSVPAKLLLLANAGATSYTLLQRRAVEMDPGSPPGLSGDSASAIGLYTGLVANRLSFPVNKGAAPNVTAFSRKFHTAMVDIRDPVSIFANWYVPDGSGELLPGAARTITCAIEYPAGVFTQLTKNGSPLLVQADGETSAFDPAIGLHIPEGARFWERTWQSCGTGFLYMTNGTNVATGSVADTGETWVRGAEVADNTMTGANPNNQDSSYMFGASAIVALTDMPAVALLGDSKLANNASRDYIADSGRRGELERGLGARFSTLNCGVSQERINTAVTRYTGSRRAALINQYCTHIVSNLGVNDIVAGADTVANMLANLVLLKALFPGKPWGHATCAPCPVVSTDGYATVANQTASAFNAVRVEWNGKVRRCTGPIDFAVEVADQVESARDSGKWKAADRMVSDAGVTAASNLLNSATANFSSKDQGTHVSIPGAGAAGGVGIYFINSINSPSQAVLNANVSTTVASGPCHIGLTVDDGLHESTAGCRMIEASKAVTLPGY